MRYSTSKNHSRFGYYCVIIFLSLKIVHAQDSTAKHSIKGEVKVNAFISSAQTPFWLKANQMSVVPTHSAASLEGYIGYEGILSKKNTHWKTFGEARVVGNVGNSTKLFIPVVNAGIQFKKLALYVGRKREQFGFSDTTLGTGSYSWSGNALPMPKIQFEITDYIPLKFLKNLFAFKGTYAHGWFGNSQYAYDYYLHQKSLYIRMGRENWAVNLYGGFNHQVQWGGKTNIDIATVVNRKLPSSFGDYVYAVTGWGALIGDVKGVNAFDSLNRVGNHLGTIDMGITFDLKKYELTLYRQNIYEDGSLYYLTNIADGLNGLVVRNLFPSKEKGKVNFERLVLEFLYTLSQGDAAGVSTVTIGNDNYFNHQQYYDGWSYKGEIIGTPFFTNAKDTKNTDPQNGYEIANNNRVRVYHLGLQGNIGENIQFLSKLSLSHNYGTYNFPYAEVPKQFSALLQFTGTIKRWQDIYWNAAFAMDNGQLYHNSIGTRIGISKRW
ncbi:capsule assembly Wzi family protein [Runella sp. MFBS21]|uniref:capsule assembly Wzi family protein n=1 Tax=Runella sp. MFBS21 TaxID=3034018 RepID=UPI0023F9050B|nr:capsule assembly Wzi family protein [Runella sp. MFBS21]MDF7822095.1 capsule assembly Wzi family protein [Runella sp. MFBS21]